MCADTVAAEIRFMTLNPEQATWALAEIFTYYNGLPECGRLALDKQFTVNLKKSCQRGQGPVRDQFGALYAGGREDEPLKDVLTHHFFDKRKRDRLGHLLTAVLGFHDNETCTSPVANGENFFSPASLGQTYAQQKPNVIQVVKKEETVWQRLRNTVKDVVDKIPSLQSPEAKIKQQIFALMAEQQFKSILVSGHLPALHRPVSVSELEPVSDKSRPRMEHAL